MSIHTPDPSSDSSGRRLGDRHGESPRGFAAFLLRGGRLTKLAGEVASCAPALGGAAVALLSSLSAPVAGVLAGAFLGLTAQQAAACSRVQNAQWPNYKCGNRTTTISVNDDKTQGIRFRVTSTATINVSSGLAFDLNDTGTGGIDWRHEEATGNQVTGGTGVIEATNAGGGNITISANATLEATTNSTTIAVVTAINEDSSDGNIVLNLSAVSSRLAGHAIRVRNDGAGKTDITARGAITAGTRWGDGIRVRGDENDNANTSLNISVGTVTGFHRGILIDHKGRGNVSIVATGAVTSTSTATGSASDNDDAIRVVNDNGASAVNMTLNSVKASAERAHAIYLEQKSSGSIVINATGAVSTTGSGNGHVVQIKRQKWSAATLTFTGGVTSNSGGGDAINIEDPNQNLESAPLTISVATATGRWSGIRVKHRKGGTVTITATGAVTGGGGGDPAILLENNDHASALKITAATVTAQGTGDADGIRVVQNHGGTVEINASGPVTTAGRHGIYVKQDGGDAVTINVTGTVTGDDDTNDSAIRVAAGSGDAVAINLNSGASVGTANEDAVVETGGNATVSVNAGSHVRGAIKLGDGSDKVILAGGTAGGSIDFGGGADTLEVTASGAVSIPSASNLETLSLGAGVDVSSAVALSGNGSDVGVTLAAGTDVSVTTGVAFTMTQTGAGGITFTQAASGQTLSGQSGVISATNSGAGNISITATGELSKTGSAGNTLNAVNEDGAGGDIVISVATVTGTTGGGNAIRVKNDGAGKTDIEATGHVNGGGDGIRFDGDENNNANTTLTITAAAVTGKFVGIRIDHKGAGDVSITATGAVASTNTSTSGPGVSDPGIALTNRNGASSVTLSVAAVTASAARGEAIKVEQHASGPVTITGTGAITRGGTGNAHVVRLVRKSTGTASLSFTGAITASGNGDAINIEDAAGDANAAAASLFISVAAATGGWAGLRIKHRKGGDVTIIATGTVTSKGGGDKAISLVNETHASNLKVTAATVTAQGTNGGDDGATGIFVHQKHGGTVEINAGGPVTSSGGHGIFVKQEGDGAVTINVTGTVTGDDDDNESAIKVAAGGNDAVTINLNSGAVVGSANEDAIVETGGDTTVTVNSNSVVHGAIKLGAGTDELILAGGTLSGSLDFGAGKDTFTINVAGDRPQATGVEVYGFGPNAEINEAVAVSGATSDGIEIELAGGTDVDVSTGTVFTLAQSGAGGVEFTQTGTGDTISGETGVIRATNDGEGSIDITAMRTIQVSGAGAGVYAKNDGDDGDDVNIDVTTVSAADGHGVHVVQDGSGTVEIDVRGTVTGGGDNAAIMVSAGDGDTVKVNLESGAVLGARDRKAVVETAGNAVLLVKSGATVRGNVNLGSGNADKIEVNGTADLVSLENVEIIKVGATGSATIDGAITTAVSLQVDAGGTLNVQDGGVNDHNFSGELTGGGIIKLDVDVANGAADKFTVTGSVTGETKIDASLITRGAGREIEVFNISGSAGNDAFKEVNGARYVVKREEDGGSVKFYVVTNDDCAETASGSGVFTCAGRILFDQALSASGSTDLRVTLDGSATVDVTNVSAFSLTQTGGTGDIAFTQSANGNSVSGTQSGIVASNLGGGAISIDVNGSVTGAAGDGISATNDASGEGITITAGSVSGVDSGIKVAEGGLGAVSIVATGSVAASGTNGVGIDATTSGGALTITAAGVSGAATGIKVTATGAGSVAISASGDVVGTANDGIFVDHNGAGATTVAVSSTVTGGAGAGNAAIRTDVSSGSHVTVTLNNGASVGASANNAIVGSGGNTAVTVNTGATILGKISLGNGSDTLTFVGGTFSDVTEMDGGGGSGDTLTFRSGSGVLHDSIVGSNGAGLKGWESIVVESGATITGTITLADDSDNLTIHGVDSADLGELKGGGGTANTLTLVDFNGNEKVDYSTISGSLSGWETFGIGDGSKISLGTSAHTHAGGLIVASGGTLDLSGETIDALTVSGNFTGGGRIDLDVNFASGANNSVTSTQDTLTISGNVAGSTTTIHADVDFNGQVLNNSPERIDLVTLEGTVTNSAFALNGSIGRDQDPYGYTLAYDSAGKKFYLKRLSNTRCKADTGAGAFTCDGLAPIELSQSVSANGSTTLAVTLTARTGVAIDGMATAFNLTQSGGTGGISFTQSATGQAITAAVSGIVASNSNGGAISIDVNGSVAGAAGDGISATNDASGEGITITAGSVSGADSGIKASQGGSGAVSIVATGSVAATGTDGVGIDATTRGGALTITAASVSGAATGIKVTASGTGSVAISASGSVVGTAKDGIFVDHNGGDALTITAAGVSGAATGIKVTASGTDSIAISASGSVVGTANDGIFVDHNGGDALTITAAGVSGAAGIKVTASGTDSVAISASGSVVGTANDGIFVDHNGDDALTITAAGVSGATTGIKVTASGTGSVAISASGSVVGTANDGIFVDHNGGDALTITAASVSGAATGIKVTASGTGSVAISASGSVVGTANDGIFVDHNGVGATTVAVSSTVTGGTGAGNAAIRTDVSTGSDVTVTLGNGASVGASANNAIAGSGGDTAVTVNTGATVAGKIVLGSGTDALTFAGGTFSDVTEMDGGGGSGDTLTFRSGSGGLSDSIVGANGSGLKGWESIVVESGATITGTITLAGDSRSLTLSGTDVSGLARLDGGSGAANTLALNGVSDTLPHSNLTGWETVRIGDGSTISFGTGTHALDSGLSVAEGGVLNLGNASGTDESLTVSGNFEGGGTVALNVSASATMADMLTISGDASGATTVDVRGIVMDDVFNVAGSENDVRELKLIVIEGSVDAGAFDLAAGVSDDDDPYRFTLSFRESEKAFFLKRLSASECEAGTGAFTCEGRAPIELPQALGASGTADLTVVLDSQTRVDIDSTANAFTLTQTGGAGGISFTQSANGKNITAPLSAIVADNKAGGAIVINVNGSVSGERGDGIKAQNDASGGGITISAGSVNGSAAGIMAVGHGSGTVSVSAAGSVSGTAANGIGISATAGRRAAGLSIVAASVSGGDIGIRAVGSGGAISVSATGAVTGTGTAGVQVDGRVDVTDVAVSVATVTGGAGVHVYGGGSGSVDVRATGAVRGTGTVGGTGVVTGTGGMGYGIRVVAGDRTSSVTVVAADAEGSRTGIRVTASGGADVSVVASGDVEGKTRDGIYLDLDGRGDTDVSVSGSVMGGADVRTAAIRTVSQVGGSAVRITLASGASVGQKGRRAIADTRGDATVTVNTGAAVAGEVRLGAGSDALVFEGGGFSNVTVMDGGLGVDTLRFVRGSGALDPSVQAVGLKGWESVVVESGATISGSFTLAADSGNATFKGADVGNLAALTTKAGSATLSFEGASGSIDGGSVSGWSNVRIGDGAKIGFGTGNNTLATTELSVGAGGTLDVGVNDSAANTLTISGAFAGGGTVALDANFANATSDKIVITGDLTGRTNVLISRVGDIPAANRLDQLKPITGVISVQGTIAAGAAFGGFHELGAFGYQLKPSANPRVFDLIPAFANKCESPAATPGAFTCSGTNTIGVTQALSASGTTHLNVTLNSESRVEAGGDAFVLVQTGGSGNLSLTQSATGQEISGGTNGIVARNDGGGTISIDVNGSVTAAGGDGIRATDGSGGSGVAVVAAGVSGSDSGVTAIGSGAGEVAVRTAGTVTGTSDAGIHAQSDGAASVSIGAAAVSGGKAGIRAIAGSGAGNLTITAAAVNGGVTGIHAIASGTSAVSIMASGAVSGDSGDGILLERTAAGRASISVSGPVGGGSGDGVAAIRTDAPSGSAISISVNDGAAVGVAGRNAIIGGAGATEVTVNSGASVTGGVDLGGGADSLAVRAGARMGGEVTLGDGSDEVSLSLDANMSGVTRLDGGDGDGDTLRIDSGSGSLPENRLGSDGLEGWESVVVESGAALSGRIRLAANSRNLTFAGARTRDVDFLIAGGGNNVLAFNGVSDSLDANLEGWETVEIGSDSRVRFDAAQLRETAAQTLSVKGTLAFGSDAPGDAFAVDGDFAGGGSVAVDVNFAANADGRPTADRLAIGGDVTESTALAINDVTPAAGVVVGGDMDIVTVSGDADASSFTLESDPVSYGAYIYDLEYVAGSAGRDSKFVLSPGDQVSDAGAVLKSAPAAIAGGFARAATLAARTAARMPTAAVGAGLGMSATSGERGAALAGQGAADMAAAPARSLWARFLSDSQKTDATGTVGESEVSSSGFQIGADLLSGESAGGMWVAGLMVQYGSVSAEAKGSGGTGKQDATGSGIGAAWTWFGTSGLYVDAQAQFGSFEADYTADTVDVIKKGVGGGTSLAALEIGRRFAAGGGMMIVPKGRLGWSSVSTDKFTSEQGIDIDLGTASTTEASLGMIAEFALGSGGVRLSGNLSRNLSEPDGVVIAGQTVEQDIPDGWMEFGFGGSYDIDEDKVLFLDGAWRTSLGGNADSTGMSLSGGFKINW